MKISRIVCSILLISVIIFTCFYGVYKIGAENYIVKQEDYQDVLTLWQIDNFEGGTGSRKQFLMSVARKFEKNNKGILIMVLNLTKEGAEENFNNGIFPDMISYGHGVEVKNVSEFVPVNTVKGGLVDDRVYATAWCRGGYVMIKNPNFKNSGNADECIIVSQGEYTQPLTALCMEEIDVKSVKMLSPMDAYVKFVSGKAKYFLGTQRDVNRLSSREMLVEIVPFEKYNDLYQYISITSIDGVKKYYSKEFINYLVSEKIQKELNKIGMMSCYYSVDFENENLTIMQSVKNNFLSLSIFTPTQNLIELRGLSLSAVYGNKDAKIKIKNILI